MVLNGVELDGVELAARRRRRSMELGEGSGMQRAGWGAATTQRMGGGGSSGAQRTRARVFQDGAFTDLYRPV